jgi:hypothetical protein
MQRTVAQIAKALGLDIPTEELAEVEIVRQATQESAMALIAAVSGLPEGSAQESAVWAGCMTLLSILPREKRIAMLLEMVGAQ